MSLITGEVFTHEPSAESEVDAIRLPGAIVISPRAIEYAKALRAQRKWEDPSAHRETVSDEEFKKLMPDDLIDAGLV